MTYNGPYQNETVGEWQNRTLVEKALEEQAAQRTQAEAERNKPAPMPENETEALVNKYKAMLEKEYNERKQLTQSQRDYEALTGELTQLQEQYQDAFRNASRNGPLLDKLEKEISEKSARHEQLEKELTPEGPLLMYGGRYVGGTGNHTGFDTSEMAKEMREYRNPGE